MLVEQYPGFIVPVNMFALDLRGLGGVIRRQNTTETEAEPWVFHRVLYNLQQVDTANNIFLKNICTISMRLYNLIFSQTCLILRSTKFVGL